MNFIMTGIVEYCLMDGCAYRHMYMLMLTLRSGKHNDFIGKCLSLALAFAFYFCENHVGTEDLKRIQKACVPSVLAV